MYNYSKLRGRIKEKYGSEQNFSEHLKMTDTSLSFKLNNKRDFKQSEIRAIMDLLDISKNQLFDYFFVES